jgi:hypothetical protein
VTYPIHHHPFRHTRQRAYPSVETRFSYTHMYVSSVFVHVQGMPLHASHAGHFNLDFTSGHTGLHGTGLTPGRTALRVRQFSLAYVCIINMPYIASQLFIHASNLTSVGEEGGSASFTVSSPIHSHPSEA